MSAQVRDAASVVLVRDGAAGIEAWLLTRVSGMAFAAGMTVFPGGRVEADDAALPLDPDAVASVASRFGCDGVLARALLGAAVRETFEETGVLLSSPPAELSEARADVEQGRVAFADLLARRALRLDGAALHPWARWVTPEGSPRRYDTRFFVGVLPAGAQPREGTTEAADASWVGLADALAQGERGERGLMAPTRRTLESLARFETVADALAEAGARDLAPVMPVLRTGRHGAVHAELPDGSSVAMPRRPRR